MAWHCSGTTNRALIENLKTHNIIKTRSVFEAMLTVDRGNYAPGYPYADSPQYIGYDATISAPHMHASALEYLYENATKANAKILDVGCGSGYLSALFSRMNPTAHVLGVDYIPQLVALSKENTMKQDGDLLLGGKVKYVESSGWDLSAVTSSDSGVEDVFLPPYDVIHVGAAAREIPQVLIDALKTGGRMIIPVGPNGGDQELLQVDRNEEGAEGDGRFTVKSLMGVRYVPLVE